MVSGLFLALAVGAGAAQQAALAQAGAPGCAAEPGRLAERVSGEVSRGRAFEAVTLGGWILRLVPSEDGWLLQVAARGREAEDLSRLTPPWHGVPNPREIDGWHFRNAANTGPNDGSVNAPQALREFVFSPEVGRGLEYAGSATLLEDVEKVRAFGRGWLFVESYALTPPVRGGRAAFESMRFSACLTWPADGPGGGEHQEPAGPPMPYEDPGACPFEGCAYREWAANAAVRVLSARRDGSPVAFTVRRGERVMAMTGVVITKVPGRVEFRKAVDLPTSSGVVHVEPGQSLYLLTYRGEGFTKAWFKGRLYDDLDGGAAFFGDRCERDPGSCAGTIVHRPVTVWWVQIRNEQGQAGWTSEPEKFDGKSTVGR